MSERSASRGLRVAALLTVLAIGVAGVFLLRRGGQSVELPLAVVEPEPAPGAVVPGQREPEVPPQAQVVREPTAPGPEPVHDAEASIEPASPEASLAPPSREPAEISMTFPADPIVYSPPEDLDPLLPRWRVPGVVRNAVGPSVKIQALAPDHTGLTARASPTLYWVLSAGTDLRVELVLTDEIAEEPLVQQAFDGADAGIHALHLAEHGVVLAPGTTYRWYATVVPDPEDRSSEVASGGAIERVELDPGLVERLAEAGPGRRAHVLAEEGLFYDAFDVVSTWITDHPEAAEPRRDRAALLQAVGLGKALPEVEGRPTGAE